MKREARSVCVASESGTSPVSWIALKTNCTRLEAELMQQILAAHEIPSRIIDVGMTSYLGVGAIAVVQVLPKDRWTALLLLSQLEEEQE